MAQVARAGNRKKGENGGLTQNNQVEMLPPRSSLRALLPAAAAALLLTGCAAFRSYDLELQGTLEHARSGNVEAALRRIESQNRGAEPDLLYYLERGMLERLARRYEESQKAWAAAASRIELRSALLEAKSLLADTSSYLISDKLRTYEAHDYEKVMLLTFMALNHLARDDYDRARVAIRQTHELEATIAERRARQLAEVEAEAAKRGARTSVKELNGYPVQTLDNPEVHALRNSYQSALSHYLAGFVYESLGEASLAAPGYRLANELQPGVALLEEALRGLDERIASPADGTTDVLFLVAAGTAPALRSQHFSLFVPVQGGAVFVPVAFPVMAPDPWTPYPSALTIGEGPPLSLAPLTSIDLMARRQLLDDMPAIMLRATVRATTSAVLQYQAQRSDNRGGGAAFAALLGLGTALLATADDRTWRTLPSQISVARARLPEGTHRVAIDTPQGRRSARVEVSGRTAVIDFWLLGGELYGRSRPQSEGRK
jgi:uncharacterized protein